MKAKDVLLLLTISLGIGLALSAASVVFIGQKTVTMYNDDPNYSTHIVKRGFPVPYLNISEGTACNGGAEASLRGILKSGQCGRDLDRSGIPLVLNTLVWFLVATTSLLLLKLRSIKKAAKAV